jgi:peptidoglycan/LPS O-acetylase OafA/YrhL
MGSDTRIDSILFGCALAVWSSPVKDKLVLNERRWQFLYVPAAIVLLLLCVIARSNVFRETIRYSVQGIALTLLFIAAIRYPLWTPMRVLNTKTFVFVGALSYSLYLLHFAVIIGIQKNYPGANPVEQGVLALCMSVALSWLIYVVIEKPCAKLRRRLTASRPARGALVGAGQTGVS